MSRWSRWMMRGAPIVHLVRRFLESVRPGAPSAADEAWAESWLLPGEVDLWRRLPDFDRRHAIGVARRARAALAGMETRPEMAAALLHDVGKIVSGLGVSGRVVATVVPAPLRRGRLAAYRDHPRLGGELLRAAGSDDLTIAWAEDHHKPSGRWRVPPATGSVLKAADDD